MKKIILLLLIFKGYMFFKLEKNMKEIKTILQVSFVFLILATSTLSAQSFEEQIKLQILYSQQLTSTRGAQPLSRKEVTEENIREVLEKFSNAGILVYTHFSDTLSVTLITKTGPVLNSKVLISEENLVNEVKEVNEYVSGNFSSQPIANRGSVVVSENKKITTLKKTYENLNDILLPFKDDLKKLDHLIIVPTLNIATLPFAAFKFSEKTYLIDLMSYSISPSLCELAIANDKKRFFGEFKLDFNKALFVSNPDFSLLKEQSFSALPGTKLETDYITKSLNKDSYLLLEGKDATKSNVLKNIVKYDLLYFATHGVANNEDALDKSFLVLSGGDESNSYLTSREIQNLSIGNAQLVVLSACQTGLGKVHKGGVIGLARAFQIAGANNVLMSLWSVNDKETATLMSMFFDELKKGGEMMPHGAIRDAILKYKEINNDPKYWAAFSLFGIPNENFDDITQKLHDYGEAAISDNINLIKNDNQFEFKLLPVSYNAETNTAGELMPVNAYVNKFGIFEVNTRDSHVLLQVTNNSPDPLYFTIIEFDSQGNLNPFMPSGIANLSTEERKIAPGETKIFKNIVYSFEPPYEKFLLKGFATLLPFDFLSREQTHSKDKMDGYTAEFLFEVVK